MTRFLAMGVLAFVLTGCGTVGNFLPGSEKAQTITMSPAPERTTPFGGVKVAINGIKEEHDVALTFTFPFRMADVALSAVGDTVTLPVTLPIAFVHAVHDSISDYYFPKPGTPRNAQAPNWLQDSQPATTAPSTVPGTPGNSPDETGAGT